VSGTLKDIDLDQLGAAMVQLDAEARERNAVPATILIVILDGDPPSANQRRRMAQLWEPTKAPLHLFAIVTSSSVARGILKVVQWLNPPGTRRRETTHKTFADAVRWTESERRKPGTAFHSLFAELDRGTPKSALR
jgi:hypothetical protein